MKPPPTNPAEFGARVFDAFLADLRDSKSKSFDRTDALRSACAALAGSEPERRLSGDRPVYACASHAPGSRSSDGSGNQTEAVTDALRHVVSKRGERP